MTDYLRLAKDAYASSTTFLDSNHRGRWEDAIRMFHSQHPRNSKYNSEAFKYRSRIFRPKSRSVVRKHEATAAMAFFSNLDVLSVSPVDGTDEKQIASAIISKELVQYRLSKTIPWFQTLIGAFQDTMKTGLCVSFTYWKYKSKTSYEERIGYDPDTLEQSTVQVPIEDVYEDEPCVELHPIENLRFSPNANWTNVVKTSPYLILIQHMFVYKIKELVAEKGNGIEWYPVSDAQMRAVSTDSLNSMDAVRRGQKSSLGDQNPAPMNEYDVVPVHLNFMDGPDGKMVYYTLKDQYLLSEPVPLEQMFWHGEIPIIVGKCIIDSHNPLPESLIDLGKQLQTETNEVSNQRLDNVKLVLNKRYMVRRNANVDTESLLRNVPGGVTMVGNTAADGGDVREVNWQDVTSSSYQEQDRINVDYDDLTGGGLNSGSVMTNRKLNETVGGMKIMAQGSNNLTEYTIRTFVETWVEPQLRLLMLAEQYYESDEVILALAGKKANLYQKFGIDKPTDWLLINELTVTVNVGMGATDPDAKFQHFMQANGAYMQIAQTAPPDANLLEIKQELFGLAGYRDSNRFYSGKIDPRMEAMQKQMQQLQQQAQQLQQQLQTELGFVQEKRAIDEKKMKLSVDELKFQASTQQAQGGEDMQAKLAIEGHKLAQDGRIAEEKLAIQREQSQAEMDLKQRIQEAELALEREKINGQLALQRAVAEAELAIKERQISGDQQIKRDSATAAKAEKEPAQEKEKPEPQMKMPDIHIHMPSGKKKLTTPDGKTYISEDA